MVVEGQALCILRAEAPASGWLGALSQITVVSPSSPCASGKDASDYYPPQGFRFGSSYNFPALAFPAVL